MWCFFDGGDLYGSLWGIFTRGKRTSCMQAQENIKWPQAIVPLNRLVPYQWGFFKSQADKSLYVKQMGELLVVVIIYVDDLSFWQMTLPSWSGSSQNLRRELNMNASLDGSEMHHEVFEGNIGFQIMFWMQGYCPDMILWRGLGGDLHTTRNPHKVHVLCGREMFRGNARTTNHDMKEAIWLMQLLPDMEFVQEGATSIMCNNQGV